MKKLILKYFCAGCLLIGNVRAQSPVTITVNAQAPGCAVPDDFSGLSFETSTLLPGTNRDCILSGENPPLITLFRTLGIKSLRVGGGTADIARYPVPGPAEIDPLFAFARAADVRVIYTFRLLNGDPANAAALARYIEQHYPQQLDCFAIGNEPDWPSYHNKDSKLTDYPSFLADWNDFAGAIRAAVPGAKFEGPCTGSNFPDPGAKNTGYHGKSWTRNFADDEKGSANIAFISQHTYPGGDAKNVAQSALARDQMLSPAWIEGYQELFDSFVPAARADGFRYRMEETSNFSGGVTNASNTFAAALWALDFMHWWAAHGAGGVNFHNRRQIPNVVIHPAAKGRYAINPIGYGIKAFDLGGHGRVMPLTISNPAGLNLTAYAVRSATNFLVTIINKEHGPGARASDVTIVPEEISRRASVMFLAAPNGDVAAKTGVTLGGASITDDGPWLGEWTPLRVDRTGYCTVTVPAAAAAVVKFSPE